MSPVTATAHPQTQTERRTKRWHGDGISIAETPWGHRVECVGPIKKNPETKVAHGILFLIRAIQVWSDAVPALNATGVGLPMRERSWLHLC